MYFNKGSSKWWWHKKSITPNQQEIENEEDILKKYNNSLYEYYCNYLFPQAIEYGMSSEEFWKDDPQLFVSYRTSFINKKKREMEEVDFKCWLVGLYVYDGNNKINASLKQLLINMFSDKKNKDEIESYPTEPFFYNRDKNKETKKEKEEREKQERYENYVKTLNYYGSIKQRYLDNLTRK